jgi:tetratricopeptide (TPR) repeat protein
LHRSEIADGKKRETGIFRGVYRRILTEFGQPSDLVYLEDAVLKGMEWVNDAKNPPPPELFPLLEKFLSALSEIPRDSDEENGPALMKGELIAHRDGPVAGIAFLRTLAATERESEDTRAEARARIGDLLVKEGKYEEALREWDAIQPATLANESRQVAAVYLCLAGGRNEEAWRRVDKLVEALKRDELLDEDAADQAEHMSDWTKRRAKIDRWWKVTGGWWPEWELLAASLGIDPGKSAEPVEFIASPPEKYLEILSKEESGEAHAMIARALRAARWDPSQADIAVRILRESLPRLHPASKTAARSLAKKVESQK